MDVTFTVPTIANDNHPSDVTLAGIITEVKDVCLKAPLPIVTKVFGKDTEVRRATPSKALSLIDVTPSGMLAVPVQLVWVVTTFETIVKVPEVQETSPSACTGVR